MFPTIPPTKATGLGPPSAPTPNTQGPPFQYGHPGPVGSQYYAAGMGVGAPQLYYGAPPYPPFSHHGNAGPWGYGQYDEQHRCMGLNSHGVSKVSVRDAAGVKQVEHK